MSKSHSALAARPASINNLDLNCDANYAMITFDTTQVHTNLRKCRRVIKVQPVLIGAVVKVAVETLAIGMVMLLISVAHKF